MRIAVLLSGGVDSSVALRLLREEGHEVHAFYLKIWLEDELAHLGDCPWEKDLRFAREVCATADVPLEVVSLQREYHRLVVSWTIAELSAGRTPSPDILCNRHVKFGAFFETVADRPFDRVASGHYARIRRRGEDVELFKGSDPVKDQTYFLFRLSQSQLGRCLFPVGELHKSEVRDLAHRFELPNRERKDSQGICFLGKIRFDDFVRSYLGERRGEIREVESGRRLGEHRGYWFHTTGQRRGLGLGGGPWYVVAKDVRENVVYVSNRSHLAEHRRDRFAVPDVHWIGRPPESDRLDVKVRHSPKTIPCRIRQRSGGGLEVRLDEADPGIAEGQWAVLYDGERCLGGGMIATP
ncbi:MAG: tRNA 2-thiouridine(34) synthase MnmA [bacterium]|nr:tRNA 2-thiouridine(34) synthase MnmA [bacterium]